jgi:hypothetical protein
MAYSKHPGKAALQSSYEEYAAARAQRFVTGLLATRYRVTTVTIRKWLGEIGLYETTPRIPPRPITTPCPCSAVATTRYKGQDPPLCFRCYMRTYASDSNPGFHRTSREYIAELKANAVCADCGGKFDPCVYHFDHVPERGPKLFNVANCDVSIERLRAEIAKCDIVCGNCHAVRTWMTREKPWLRRRPAEEVPELEPTGTDATLF